MAFYEEEKSNLEKLIGRRMPLAALLIIATVLTAYWHMAALSEGLLVIDGIIITAYFKDVGQEKQTIKMVTDEIEEIKKDG